MKELQLLIFLYNASLDTTNALITWDLQPPGINNIYNATNGQFKISGTPQGIDSDTTYNYTIRQSTLCWM